MIHLVIHQATVESEVSSASSSLIWSHPGDIHQGSPPVHYIKHSAERLTGTTSAKLDHCATWPHPKLWHDTMSEAESSCLPSPEKFGSRGMPWVIFSWQFDGKMKNPQREVQYLAATITDCFFAWSPHATLQILSLKRNHGDLHFASLNAL